MSIQCPACGAKSGGYIIWHCPDCGDTRCTKAGCKGTMNKGNSAPGNYGQVGCRVCGSKKVKKIG